MDQGSDRVIIAGGGLSGCLVALALARLRPELPLLLIEEQARFGGNHVWSFFDPDVAAEARWLVDPLIVRSWSEYDVRFPSRSRTLPTPYNSLTSELLEGYVRRTLREDQYRLGQAIAKVEPGAVTLAGGERIAAGCVIDARGPAPCPGLDLGWQKFLGRTLRFERPHGLARPLVMDATVDQSDGYRFVYCLPFSATEMLVEDTYYDLSHEVDPATLRRRVDGYVERRGWGPATIVAEERGVLPVALGGAVDALWSHRPAVPRVGLRGGFFHPTTGYTLPDAVRVALLVADQRELASEPLFARLRGEARRLWRERRFYRLLNRMLLKAAAPERRYRVLQHFYRLEPQLIGRFYAGRSTLRDKVRIVSGRPPVPVSSALRALASGAGA